MSTDEHVSAPNTPRKSGSLSKIRTASSARARIQSPGSLERVSNASNNSSGNFFSPNNIAHRTPSSQSTSSPGSVSSSVGLKSELDGDISSSRILSPSGSTMSLGLNDGYISPQGLPHVKLRKEVDGAQALGKFPQLLHQSNTATVKRSSNVPSTSQALTFMKKGTTMLKYVRKGSQPHFRLFSLSLDHKSILWYSQGKEQKRLTLDTIVQIQRGQSTPTFVRRPNPKMEHLSFSLLFQTNKNEYGSLDLVNKDETEHLLWLVGLRALLPKVKLQLRIKDWISEELSAPPDKPPADATGGAKEKWALVRGVAKLAITTPGSTDRKNSSKEFLGSLYAWGKDAAIRCGAEKGGWHSKPELVLEAFDLDIQEIACGHAHVVCITSAGELHLWGQGSDGRLGVGVPRKCEKPVRLKLPDGQKPIQVACGERHTCVVSREGEVYTWGSSGDAGILGHGVESQSLWQPLRIASLPLGTRVASVACSARHSAIITSEGRLYTWGEGVFGQLGHGNKEDQWSPRLVAALEDEKVVAVACGPLHTAASVQLAQGGSLYTWGDGRKGKLGHGTKENELRPKLVESLGKMQIVAIACGSWHTLALSAAGKVFSCGDGGEGQHGRGHDAKDKVMGIIPALKLKEIKSIACGDSHSIALGSDAIVYAWGSGAGGVLGNGSLGKVEEPEEIQGLTGMRVCKLATSPNMTMAICKHSAQHAITRDVGGSWDITELLDAKTTAEVKINKNLKYSIAPEPRAEPQTQQQVNKSDAVQKRRPATQASTAQKGAAGTAQPRIQHLQSLASDRLPNGPVNPAAEVGDLRFRFRRAEAEIAELQGALETATNTIANKSKKIFDLNEEVKALRQRLQSRSGVGYSFPEGGGLRRTASTMSNSSRSSHSNSGSSARQRSPLASA